MKRIIAKTFYKRKYVKAIIISAEKRISTHYVIPSEENFFTIGDKSYFIDKNLVAYDNGEPTYFYNYDSVDPIKIIYNDEDIKDRNPIDFNSAISTHIWRDLIRGFNKSGDTNINTILLGVLLVAIVGGGYLLFNQLQNLSETINRVIEYIQNSGGGLS